MKNLKDGNELGKELFVELEEYIDSMEDEKGTLIAVLHKAQSVFGYLPQEVQSFVAEKLKLPYSKVYGVVKFYAYFTMVPRGNYHISICTGTACYIKDAGKILEEFENLIGIKMGEVSEDGMFSISTLRCIGACGLAPVITVNEEVYGNLVVEVVKRKIDSYSRENQEETNE